jgi:hypothetical protein
MICGAPSCKAQVLYGSVLGNVTDPSGAPVGGAKVVITELQTNVSRSTTTDQSGAYSFPDMPAGAYHVVVSKAGFQTADITGLVVTIDRVSRADAPLKLGAVTQAVEVSAQTQGLQTESPEVQTDIGQRQLENLPVPVNRNFENLLVTVPGFTPPANQFSVAANPSQGETFSVNGTTRQSNNVRIDGASANNVWLAEVAGYVPGLEAIETVSVVTSTPDISEGLAGGAIVDVHIKSGTNELHGTGFEYNMNNDMTARPFFSGAGQLQPKNINNDFGGVLGGPIKKNKLFYFVSLDTNKIRQNAGTYVTVPTAAMRAGDMSGSPTPIYDPASGTSTGTGRTAFLNNQIPASRISPIAQAIQNMVPLPNLPGGALANNYYATGDYSVNRYITDAKGDWDPTDKLRFSTRLGWLNYSILNPAAFGLAGGPPIASGRAGTGWGNVYNGTVNGTYIARPTLVVDSYFTLLAIQANSEPPGLGVNRGLQLGIPGTNGPSRAYSGLPEFSISSFTVIGDDGSSGGPIYYWDREYQYAANATWIKGRHSVRFGFEWGHQDLNHFEPTIAPGQLSFATGVTQLNAKGAPAGNQFNSYAGFLLGLASSANSDLIPFNGNRAVIVMPTYNLFVQDRWQAAKNLTITAGLGWNYFPMGSVGSLGIERYNYQTNIEEICGEANIPHDCGYHVSKKDFSPNFGFAYRVTPSFVIRSGFSLNWDPEPYAYNRDLFTNYPYSLAQSLTAPNTYWYATTLSQGIPAITVPNISSGYLTIPPGYSVGSLPANPKRDYIMSWNFSLQKELPWHLLAEAGYIGTRGVDIPQQLNLNVGQVGGGTASEPFNQLFGTTASIYLLTPVNHTKYDGLQTRLSRRFSNGFLLNATYTFSKNLGICCNDTADGTPAIQLPQYINLDRAFAPTDRTHDFTLSGMYELPFGKGKPLLNRGGIVSALAGGWQLNGLFVAYTGLPFSVSGSSTSLNAPGNTQRADQVLPSVTILHGVGPGQSWFDPLAFANVTAVRFGTAGFDSVFGPGAVNLDASLFRSFRITERLNMQFRAEVFNLTNTPHFSNPGSNVSSATFTPSGAVASLGSYTVISSTTGVGREGIDQRAIRLGLRLSF